jgi:hypothetical protein
MKYCFSILFIACLASHAVFAEDLPTVHGELVISREPLSDPMPDSDMVAYMTLRGQEAVDVYNNMDPKSDYPNACGVDGMTARVAGNLICYKTKESDYLCSFGVRLTDGGLTLGKPC